ncbi:MFS transporter [Baekduia soli]|uniref:MFS transporter n=1 Tax=Baekduia soli TaxID=496014 RepID=A0A5B8U6X8_9ACTN|nr:MFS transporter [Baekduia soli]QEC48846.1 MFS transporter [Baekduia soli]
MSDLRALTGRPHAMRMLACALVGRLPEAMIALAVLLVARSHGGSYGTAGALAAAFALGATVGGPVSGRIADRVGQPLVLVATALGRGAAVAAIALLAASTLPVAAVATAAAGALTPPLEPALRALWPDIAAGDEHALHAAYELDAGAQELIFVLGPLLVAGVVALASPEAALLVTAAVGLGGTVGFAAGRPSRVWQGGRHAPVAWSAAARAPEVGLLLAVGALAGAATGLVNVTTTAFAERTLGDRNLAGWLLAAWAVGALSGGLAAAARRWTLAPDRRLTRMLLVFGAAFVPALLVRSGLPMALALALAGAALAPTLACVFVLTGARALPGTVTETFAWLTSSFLVGSAGGAAAGGALSGSGSGVRGFAGAALAVVAAAGLWQARHVPAAVLSPRE